MLMIQFICAVLLNCGKALCLFIAMTFLNSCHSIPQDFSESEGWKLGSADSVCSDVRSQTVCQQCKFWDFVVFLKLWCRKLLPGVFNIFMLWFFTAERRVVCILEIYGSHTLQGNDLSLRRRCYHFLLWRSAFQLHDLFFSWGIGLWLNFCF